MRYQLSDYEWTPIKPMLPNKPRGVRRVNERGVLNNIFWVLRSGAPWRDLPENYGPYRSSGCDSVPIRFTPGTCKKWGAPAASALDSSIPLLHSVQNQDGASVDADPRKATGSVAEGGLNGTYRHIVPLCPLCRRRTGIVHD